MTPLHALVLTAWLAFAPPKTVTVSEWADANRILSPEASAEPGRWRTERVPYLRPILDAITDPGVHTVVLQCASQVGKSEVLLNALGRTIDVDPGPVLFVLPTIEDARRFSRQRITPMLRDTPSLHGKVRTARVKDASSSTMLKTFAGGHATFAGANSPSGLATMPIRILLGDELDRWPSSVGDEGDPWAIASKRTTTFWNRRRVAASSPTTEGTSKINALFLEGDRRRFFVPCPACGARFVIVWQRAIPGVLSGFIRWPDGEPERAYLECPACSHAIPHSAKARLLARITDRPTRPEQAGPAAAGVRSFHVPGMYSPWKSWGEMAVDFLAAKRGGHETLKVFINTELAETWEEPTEQLDPAVLILRREPYEPEVPAGVCCLTMGVDVQDTRLEFRVDGWGVGEEVWLAIDSNAIPGDPSRPEPWAELAQVLKRTYRHACGADLPILATCIDSGGHRTTFVYDFVRAHEQQRVYATKGVDKGHPWGLISPPSPKRTGDDPRRVELRFIAVDTCKSLLASALRETAKGPGYVHLPLREDVGEEFCAQLTSEKPVTKFDRGQPVITWVKTRTRNEQLDLWSLSLAALRLLRPRFDDMAALLANYVPPAETMTTTAAAPAPQRWVTHSRYLSR